MTDPYTRTDAGLPFPITNKGMTRHSIKKFRLVNYVSVVKSEKQPVNITVYKGDYGALCHSCYQRRERTVIVKGDVCGLEDTLASNFYCIKCVTVKTAKKNHIVAKAVLYKPKRKSSYTFNGMNRMFHTGTKKQLDDYCRALEAAGYPVLEIQNYPPDQGGG